MPGIKVRMNDSCCWGYYRPTECDRVTDERGQVKYRLGESWECIAIVEDATGRKVQQKFDAPRCEQDLEVVVSLAPTTGGPTQHTMDSGARRDH